MAKIKCIGIIAEDESDFISSQVIIKRIINKNIAFKKALGNGCGKIRRKAADYAIDLKRRGCDLLILLHDLDRNHIIELRAELEDKLKDSPIEKKVICIPTEEFEAWFLSDPEGIRKTFNLKKAPKITGSPETISSPKEKLRDIIYRASNKTVIYLNTKHNQLISENISVKQITDKCSSFRILHDYIIEQNF